MRHYCRSGGIFVNREDGSLSGPFAQFVRALPPALVVKETMKDARTLTKAHLRIRVCTHALSLIDAEGAYKHPQRQARFAYMHSLGH